MTRRPWARVVSPPRSAEAQRRGAVDAARRPQRHPRLGEQRLLQPREVLPVVVAAVILVTVVVADAATARGTVLISLVVTAPLLVAAFTRPGVTAAVGAVSVAAAAVRLPLDGSATSTRSSGSRPSPPARCWRCSSRGGAKRASDSCLR